MQMSDSFWKVGYPARKPFDPTQVLLWVLRKALVWLVSERNNASFSSNRNISWVETAGVLSNDDEDDNDAAAAADDDVVEIVLMMLLLLLLLVIFLTSALYE